MFLQLTPFLPKLQHKTINFSQLRIGIINYACLSPKWILNDVREEHNQHLSYVDKIISYMTHIYISLAVRLIGLLIKFKILNK